MNPIKAVFQYVFPPQPPTVSEDSGDDTGFDWNPDEEAVAPTSARDSSWKRETDEARSGLPEETAVADIAAAAHTLPAPTFEQNEPVPSVPQPSLSAPPPLRPLWNEDPVPPRRSVEKAPFTPPKPPVAASPAPAPAPRPLAAPPPLAGTAMENWVRPSVPDQRGAPAAALPTRATPAQSQVPVSDFEEVYRKAGIKSPVHGYGVERVYRLLTSRRLVGLDRSVRRSALLIALDAAGVPPSDVSQDAVLRRKALTAYEAEKALELQSLRSRNESRAEALQETVETFTRQKQSQIERLAQGSTNAVRAQSDLEIRTRMEQDRLFRSLAYFVEALPPPAAATEINPSQLEAPRPPETPRIERFEATIEIPAVVPEKTVFAEPATVTPVTFTMTEPKISGPEAKELWTREEEVEAEPRVPTGETSRPAPPLAPSPLDTPSALEMSLRAAAEEARSAGWGRPAVAEDSSGDAVEALRKLRENKTDSEP